MVFASDERWSKLINRNVNVKLKRAKKRSANALHRSVLHRAGCELAREEVLGPEDPDMLSSTGILKSVFSR